MKRRSERRTALAVGAFVLVTVVAAGVILVLLGAVQRVLSRRVPLRARFADAGGLREGAVVSIAGVDIGSVDTVRLAADGHSAVAFFEVTPGAARTLRADASATLSTAGLLGDKQIELDPGRAPSPLPRGKVLEGRQPVGPGEVMAQAEKILARVDETVGRIDTTVERIATPELADEVSRTARSMDRFASSLDRGPGALHALAYDRGLRDDLRGALADVHEAARGLREASKEMGEIVDHVRHAQGTLGGLVYDPRVYEDLRAITGSVRRSAVLRTLVRFALEHHEPKRAPPKKPSPAKKP